MSLIEFIFGDGSPKTKYMGLREDELMEKYRYDTFSHLDENERLDLYQETINRRAAADLGKGFCPIVKFEDMDESQAGYQMGNYIYLNRNLYGRSPETSEWACDNMQALETVLHEYRHYWQGLMVSGLAPCDEETRRRLCANQGKEVRCIDGKRASTYLSGTSGSWVGYSMYYCQPSETDAHRWSQAESIKIMNHLREGHDTCGESSPKKYDEASFKNYEEYIEMKGHSAQIEEARENLGVNNPEEQIATVLTNEYYGENKPVDAEFEMLAHKEMIATQEEMDKELEESRAAKRSGAEMTDARKMDAAGYKQTSGVSDSWNKENGAENKSEMAAAQKSAKANTYGLG